METSNVSARGVFFMSTTKPEEGAALEFSLTLSPEITLTDNIVIRCKGRVVRVTQLQAATKSASPPPSRSTTSRPSHSTQSLSSQQDSAVSYSVFMQHTKAACFRSICPLLEAAAQQERRLDGGSLRHGCDGSKAPVILAAADTAWAAARPLPAGARRQASARCAAGKCGSAGNQRERDRCHAEQRADASLDEEPSKPTTASGSSADTIQTPIYRILFPAREISISPSCR